MAESWTFDYTGAPQMWTCPITGDYIVEASGAAGVIGAGKNNPPAGKGGKVTATLSFVGGDVITVYVGGSGGNTDGSGFNGGGTGAGGYGNSGAGGGGGGTDIRVGGTSLADRKVVGGGGGGSGGNTGGNGTGGVGGDGGGSSGTDGDYVKYTAAGGKGGTQAAGGAGGYGNNGTGGDGGAGVGGGHGGAGGGGGGGYYGGGGGGGNSDGRFYAGGGGGGSGYADPNAADVTMQIGVRSGDGQAVITFANQPPYPPSITGLDGTTIDRAQPLQVNQTFDDPNTGDSQSQLAQRWRQGNGAWHSITDTTPNHHHTWPANTFPAGQVEMQAESYDSLGVASGWGQSVFFDAEDRPSPPTITDPTAGQTISLNSYTATLSAPNVEASQWRRVADSGGQPDTSTVYQDSGTIESASQRSYTFDFPVNDRAEHIQARIRYNGLWSDWYDTPVTVSYTPPAVPSCTVSVFTAADQNGTTRDAGLRVAITNPAPSGDQPDVTENKITRQKLGGDGQTWVDDPKGRIAVGVPKGGAFDDWRVASRQQYRYQVTAQGANQTSTTGEWTE